MNARSPGDRLATAAQALAGSRFRLHGRDTATGLDCVGVLAAALTAIGRDAPLPEAYRLRSRSLPNLPEIARGCGLTAVQGPVHSGDVLLARIGACQFHVLIAASNGQFVHAHARLGRVLIGPLGDDWTIAGHWRLIVAN